MIAGFTYNGEKHSLDMVEALVSQDGEFDEHPYPVVKGMLDLIRQDRGTDIHVTEITSCPRKVYYSKHIKEYPQMSRHYWMYRGSLVHILLESVIEPGSIIERNFSRTVDGVTITGTPDKIHPGRKELADWKTAKRITLKNLPYGEHGDQVNIYRWLVEPEYEIETLLITYLDMSRCATIEVPIVSIGSWAVDRAKHLKDCLDNGILADKQTGWLCKGYCDFKDQCDVDGGVDEPQRDSVDDAIRDG